MKHIRFLFSIALISILLYSCSSVDKNALPVPMNAAVVAHINTKSLTSKLSWEEISKTNWFNSIRMEVKDSLALQVLQNPEASGVDIKDEMVFFVRRTRDGGFIGFTGRIKDVTAFEAFNKKMSNNVATAVKEGELSTMVLPKGNIVSWTANKFLYLINSSYPSWDKNHSGDSTEWGIESEVQSELSARLMKEHAKNLFNLKGDSLLITDDRYAALIKQDGDVHLWSSAEAAYVGVRNFLPFNIDKYLKSSVSASTLNFENGKIVVHAKLYSNKDMTRLFKKYEGGNFDKGLIQRLPSDSVVGLFIMNYKPEGLKEFLKLGGLDGMANSMLAEAGLTIDDIVAANKGDVLLAATDLSVKEATVNMGPDMDTTLTVNKPHATFLFATTIKDKAAFNKLLDVAKRLQGRNQEMSSVHSNINGDLFAAGNNQQKVEEFLKGGNRTHAFVSRISGHPVGLYLDIRKLSALKRSGMRADSAREAIPDIWQDVTATGGEFKDGGIVQELEINMIDKNTNSLKQLSAYMDKMSMLNKRGF